MQPIDFSRLTLDEYIKKCAFAEPRESRRMRRRDIVDAIRTMYWFHYVRNAKGNWSSAKLARHFAIGSLRGESSTNYQSRHRWGMQGFEGGRHTPLDTLVVEVEAELPGSARLLNHPLWLLLRSNSSGLDEQELIVLLSREIQDLLIQWHGREVKLRPSVSVLNRRLTCMLERRACLDSLAAVVLLLRRARMANQLELAHAWCDSLYRILILLGPSLLESGIARPLFELIELRVIPPRELVRSSYWMPVSWYVEAIQMLAEILLQIEPPLMSKRQSNAYMLRILEGRWGLDYLLAFRPVQVIGTAIEGGRSYDIDADERSLELSLNAWQALRNQRAQKN